MRKIKVTAVIAAILLAIGITACAGQGNSAPGSSSSSAAAVEQQQQGQASLHLDYTEPLPNFPFSQIRQDLIEIEAIQALGIQSTTFEFEPGVPYPVMVCPSIGLPVPVTDELSNPFQTQWNVQNSGDSSANAVAGVAVGQEDPNGVYQGDSSGTNSLCIGAGGKQYDSYNEGYDNAVTATAYWGGNPAHIIVEGAPQMPICKVQILNAAKQQAEEVCTKP